MKRVVRHLLENAIDASDGPARIEVGCKRIRWQEDAAVRLSVRDHGSGFNGDSLSQALEPFYTTKQHGTGLGLAFCRRVVEAHQGVIQVASHADGGAVIAITLPLRTTDANRQQQPAANRSV